MDSWAAGVDTGASFDIVGASNFHKKDFWTDYDTYQAELSLGFEGLAQVSFQFFSIMKQSIAVDLSIL